MRLQPSDYFEYYGLYVDKVPKGNVLSLLEEKHLETQELLAEIPEERADYRYASGKWSVKEIIGHLIDSERVFGYRALSFARGDPAHLPSMEQDDWAAASNAALRPLADLASEFGIVRRSHIALFAGFDDSMWKRRGTASGFEFTVRSFPYIILGHELHHLDVLRERYLP
ncbi:MAG: DinB family protein [Gemmatimonadota bacterium]|nr:MAG: DinB family protein [Gemmatimonadota bacterium]